MLPKYTTYKGKEHRIMTSNDALDELSAQRAQGKKPAMICVRGGYIITEAIFKKEEGKNNE